MLRPLGIAVVTFAVLLGGAFGGAALRKMLPEHHFADETKDLIRLGTGLIGTIAALVLGLLIATAKSSYDTQSAYVEQIAADLILLDEILNQYGLEARPVREQLRLVIDPLV